MFSQVSVGLRGGLPSGQRPLLGRKPPRQKSPWTEIPLDRDPPGQRSPWTEIPLGREPPTQRSPWTENPLDRDPHGQRSPGQRSPWTEIPWTETLLDRDPLDRDITEIRWDQPSYGRYTSYWNKFWFANMFITALCDNFFLRSIRMFCPKNN